MGKEGKGGGGGGSTNMEATLSCPPPLSPETPSPSFTPLSLAVLLIEIPRRARSDQIRLTYCSTYQIITVSLAENCMSILLHIYSPSNISVQLIIQADDARYYAMIFVYEKIMRGRN